MAKDVYGFCWTIGVKWGDLIGPILEMERFDWSDRYLCVLSLLGFKSKEQIEFLPLQNYLNMASMEAIEQEIAALKVEIAEYREMLKSATSEERKDILSILNTLYKKQERLEQLGS